MVEDVHACLLQVGILARSERTVLGGELEVVGAYFGGSGWGLALGMVVGVEDRGACA